MNLLINREILSEAETRFYMAELIQAVEFVHSKGYIHRYPLSYIFLFSPFSLSHYPIL